MSMAQAYDAGWLVEFHYICFHWEGAATLNDVGHAWWNSFSRANILGHANNVLGRYSYVPRRPSSARGTWPAQAMHPSLRLVLAACSEHHVDYTGTALYVEFCNSLDALLALKLL